jgi:hypothetical protein
MCELQTVAGKVPVSSSRLQPGQNVQLKRFAIAIGLKALFMSQSVVGRRFKEGGGDATDTLGC